MKTRSLSQTRFLPGLALLLCLTALTAALLISPPRPAFADSWKSTDNYYIMYKLQFVAPYQRYYLEE